MKKILIVEDDREIAELERDYLEASDFEVIIEEDGIKGQYAALNGGFDLVILDLMLPHIDGFNLCRRIRTKLDIPVIIVSARQTDIDKIRGFGLGADDYMTKPFEVKELLARVHAVMRRTDADAPVEKKLSFDRLVINLDSYELIVDGKKVDTPPKEMELLYHLASSPNRVFTRNQLLDEVWGFDYFGDSRTVDVHVKRLREKLEGVSDKWSLKTVWGVGYKFEVLE